MKVSTAEALKVAEFPQKAIHRRSNPRGAWKRGDNGSWSRTDTLYIPTEKDLIEALAKKCNLVSISYGHNGYTAHTLNRFEEVVTHTDTDIAECLASLWINIYEENKRPDTVVELGQSAEA